MKKSQRTRTLPLLFLLTLLLAAFFLIALLPAAALAESDDEGSPGSDFFDEGDPTPAFDQGSAEPTPNASTPPQDPPSPQDEGNTNPSAPSSQEGEEPDEPSAGEPTTGEPDTGGDPDEGDEPGSGAGETGPEGQAAEPQSGDCYTAEMSFSDDGTTYTSPEDVVATPSEEYYFKVKFTETGTSSWLGSIRITLPDGFTSIADVGFSTSQKTWVYDDGNQDGKNLYFKASSSDDHLAQNDWVEVTFKATTPSVPGIYTFETEAWQSNGYTSVNNMAAGSDDPSFGVFTGNVDDTITISTASGLALLAKLVESGAKVSNGYAEADIASLSYQLPGDAQISMERYKPYVAGWEGTKNVWKPIGTDSNPFKGTFDGNGSTISGLTYSKINQNDEWHIGLFGFVQGGTIKNLNLTDVNLAGENYVGGLIGFMESGTVDNCHITGTLEGDCEVGGLIGQMNGGTVTNCSSAGEVTGSDIEVGGLIGAMNGGVLSGCNATGDVSGDNRVGGLIGVMYGGTVTNCSSAGEVTGDNRVGGLIGVMYGGTVTDSYATGAVTSQAFAVSGEADSGEAHFGGLIGQMDSGSVTNSHATGAVTAYENVGGLIGTMNGGTVDGCWSQSNVSGDGSQNMLIGGLIGNMIGGTVTDSHATGTVQGRAYVGGLIGSMSDGSVTNSHHNTGDVTGEGAVGGLIGQMSGGEVTGCNATGDVTGGNVVGGLIGQMIETFGTTAVTNCQATGAVTGGNAVGGLIGSLGAQNPLDPDSIFSGGTVTDCSATGNVTGNNCVGSLIGHKVEGNITGCTATGSVNGVTPGKLVGCGDDENDQNQDQQGGGPRQQGFAGTVLPQSPAPKAVPQTELGKAVSKLQSVVTPGVIASGTLADLSQAEAAYAAALKLFNAQKESLSPAEYAEAETILAVSFAAIKAMEVSLKARAGETVDLSALLVAYNEAKAVLEANRALLAPEVISYLEAVLAEIAALISRLS